MYLTPIIAMHETTARDVVYKKKWSKQKEIKSIIHPHSHTCQSKRGLGRIYGPIQYSQVSLKRLSTVRFCTRRKIKTLVYCTVRTYGNAAGAGWTATPPQVQYGPNFNVSICQASVRTVPQSMIFIF